MDFEGLVWRYVPREAHALHIGFILLARGRWNRYAEYGCLYTSLSRDGAQAEYAKELRRIGIDAEADQPKDLLSLTVGVARVLDLTDPDRRKHFGITLETLTGDAEDDLESCRIVDIARASRGTTRFSRRLPRSMLVGISICTSMAERIICDAGMARIEFR